MSEAFILGPIITLFLGGFALSHAMHKYRIDYWFALRMMNKSQGHPRQLVTLLLLFAVFFIYVDLQSATTLLLLLLVTPIIQKYADQPFSKAILLAIPIGATIGGMVTPMGTPPNAVAINELIKAGSSITQFSPNTIGVLIIFLVTVVLWITSSLHGISDGIVALVPLICLFATRILEPSDLKELGWSTLLLVGGGMSLSVALKESGLTEFVIHPISGTMINTMSIYLVIATITLILSTFISNTVAISIMIPFMITLPEQPLLGVLMITLASSVALALPVSSPANAIVFSSGLLRTRDILKIGGLLSLAGMLTIYLAAVIYWPHVLPTL